jgi:hypothetical protein
MVKEVEELKELSKACIKHLGAEFKFAKALKDDDLPELKKQIAASNFKGAESTLRQMRKDGKWESRGERYVARDEKEMEHLLSEIGEILPEDLKEEEEKHKQELEIADGHLKKLASFYTGDTRHDILEVIHEERLLSKLPEDKGLQKRLSEGIKKLEEDFAKTSKWLGSNVAIVNQIIQWAEKLEKLSA